MSITSVKIFEKVAGKTSEGVWISECLMNVEYSRLLGTSFTSRAIELKRVYFAFLPVRSGNTESLLLGQL